MRIPLAVAILPVALLLGCGGGGSEGGSSSSGGGGAGSGSSSSGGDGCERGLVRCEGTCVDVAENDAHCGACGQACAAGEICSYRHCQPATFLCSDAGGTGTLCAGQCVGTSHNLDHCGDCGKACAATSWCNEGTCAPWQGNGTSCASPIVLDGTGNFSADFWFVDGGAQLALSCGNLDPRPTVTFRWTADKTDTKFKFKVYGNNADDVVLEVFSAAPCGPATSLGCNNDETATKLTPELEIGIEAGKTYFIVVGSFAAAAPAGRFTLHLDD